MPAAVEPSHSLATFEDAERLFVARRDSLVDVREPLVLISGVQRSGGTLINTLLDGHPRLRTHPYELHVGSPSKDHWPALDLTAGADSWFAALSEPRLTDLFKSGYRKGGRPQAAAEPPIPCLIPPSFVERLFRVVAAERAPERPRDVMDIYFTAFFNAWLDNQGLQERPKQWITAMAPRVGWGESRRRFLSDYPDGRIVAPLRDPRAWYASASRFSPRYGELGRALELWCRAAEEIVAAKREWPEQTLVVSYEAVLDDPQRAMRSIADWLDIPWHPALELPTFNRMPTEPNSSHGIAGSGVHAEPRDLWSSVLDRHTIGTIEARTAGHHREARAVCDVA
jgi:Sulfotransferase family